MMDTNAIMMIIGFISVIGTILGVMWLMDRRLKADITELKADLKADMTKMETGLKADMTKMETGLKADMTKMETGLKADMTKMETGLKADMSEIKAGMKAQDERLRVLEAKVERVQGSLDVLIHGYRYAPVAVEREGVEQREERIGESVGD